MALSMAACGNTQSQDTPKEPEKQGKQFRQKVQKQGSNRHIWNYSRFF